MRTTFGLLAATAVLTQTLAAQQPGAQTTPPIYASSVSYHVPDETRAALDTWLKDKYRRYVEGMMKENANLQAVTVSRVIYGGVNEPAANYFVSSFTQGVPKNNPEMQNKVTQQLFGKSYADFLKEAYPLRKRLGQTLTRRAAGTPPVAAEGDLLRMDFKRIPAGRMGDYLQMERDNLPLREAQVKAGKMKGWSASVLVLPAGTEREYDAFTSHTAKDLEQSLSWNQGSAAIAAQLTPPFNTTGAAMRANDLSKTIHGETRVVVMVVRRP